MATTVFACGFECGVAASGGVHVGNVSMGVEFSTTTKRSGARALRMYGSGSPEYREAGFAHSAVARFYIDVETVPNVDFMVYQSERVYDSVSGVARFGIAYRASDGKFYLARYMESGGAWTWGSSGITLTTGTWHRIDVYVNSIAGVWTGFGKIDGTDLGSVTWSPAGSSARQSNAMWGDAYHTVSTVDIFIDDFLGSATFADYPLGGGYVLSYIPSADGTHNIAGSADFYEGTNATPKLHDIYNGGSPLSDVYTYLDERPLPNTSVDFVNIVAPPNGTDYVEVQHEACAESVDPRAVEGVVAFHDAGGSGTETLTVEFLKPSPFNRFTLYNGTQNVGSLITYKRAHFSALWTVAELNAYVFRLLSSDASPDIYVDALMLEVEFPASDEPPATDLTPSATATATAIATPTLQVIGPTQNITPDAVGANATIPSMPFIGHVLTRTPDASAAATNAQAVTIGHALTLALDASAAITATPTPTVESIGAQTDITPDAAASATAAPVPTVGHALTVASGNAATALTSPAPLVGHSLTIAAAVAAAVTATAAPSLAHTATLASGNAATALDVPAPTVYVGPAPQIVAPAPSTVSTAVAAPGVAHALTLAPSPATAATATPTPTVGVAGVRTLQPDAVVTVAISAQPTLGHQFTFAPDAATTASSAAPATLSLSFTSTPDAVATTTVVAGPSVGLRLTISAPSIAAALDVPIPTVDVIAGERTITPSAAAATTAIAEPTLQVLGITTLAPAPVVSATAAIVPSLALIVSLAPASVPSATAVVSVALAHTRTLALAATPALARAIAVWVQVGPVQVGTPGIHLVTTRHGGSALTTIVGGVGVTTRAGGVRHIATGKGGITGDIAAGKVKV